ncbi:MAG: EAL domain-containing protein [Devosiaceae bacterium]|nr:EAL domain-containing protein [Devosiaceae bacterium]
MKNLADEISLVLGLIFGWALLVYLSRPVSFVQQLRRALLNGEFVPFMQPIFDISSGKIVGCEVLMRWVKVNGEVVAPFSFIPAAEQSGLIVPMTRMVMVDALERLAPRLNSDNNFKVAFNIVPVDLVSESFESQVCKIVKDAGVSRGQVVLEITERQEFPDKGKAISTIKKLRNLGFRIALDDTGVGHNGLSNVQQLGADIIKIDKIFIDRVGVDASATTIVQMLVRLAHELNMRTVAEGVETEAQLSALDACNVDEGQGFLVSKPLAFAGFEKLVSEQAFCAWGAGIKDFAPKGFPTTDAA